MAKPADDTPILERLVGALGAVLLLGVCAALVWDAWRSDHRPPTFAFAVDRVEPAGGRYMVRFQVRNTGSRAAEAITVRARLTAEPAEEGELEVDFLAAGEVREGVFLFTADPRAYGLELSTVSFSDP